VALLWALPVLTGASRGTVLRSVPLLTGAKRGTAVGTACTDRGLHVALLLLKGATRDTAVGTACTDRWATRGTACTDRGYAWHCCGHCLY